MTVNRGQRQFRRPTGDLFTLAGVAIGVGVVLLANLMKERAAKTRASCAQPVAT